MRPALKTANACWYFIRFLWWAFGPPAMILCELGQAWKGAAAADDSCAGMWLGARHPIYSPFIVLNARLFRLQGTA